MLAASILTLGTPTLVILNMADELQRRGGHVDVAALAEQLGAPVVLASARQGEGVDGYLPVPGGRHARAQAGRIAR